MTGYLHNDLTSSIIAAFYRVYYNLRHPRGFSETNLSEALAVELRRRGHAVRAQVAVSQHYRQERIGIDFLDLLVDEVIPIEVKNVTQLTKRHLAQLRVYLVDGGWPVGLLLNFGAGEPQVRRLYEPRHDPTRQDSAG